MRIIGGKYRGKKLWVPEGKDIRPTADRAREAVFNILYSHLGGDYAQLQLADIFAGSGAFGLEALSRGMQHVTFVDKDTRCVERNVKMFDKEADRLSVMKADAIALPRAKRKFDIVFMDAPYQKGLTEKALHQLVAKRWLNDHALCIIELHKDEYLDIPEIFDFVDDRIYGLARILFLRLK